MKHLTQLFIKGKVKGKEVKDKLSIPFGEHVLMHSYDLVNQRGSYTRSGRSEQSMAISPGTPSYMFAAYMLAAYMFGNVFDVRNDHHHHRLGKQI